MSKPVLFLFDTAAAISFPHLLGLFHKSVYWSTVVLAELMVKADSKRKERCKTLFAYYRQENRLITPLDRDWLIAGELCNSLFVYRPRLTKQRTTYTGEQSRRLLRDALIVIGGQHLKAVVVTDNTRDFRDLAAAGNYRLTIVSVKEFVAKFYPSLLATAE